VLLKSPPPFANRGEGALHRLGNLSIGLPGLPALANLDPFGQVGGSSFVTHSRSPAPHLWAQESDTTF
jgi:hypothetical protein